MKNGIEDATGISLKPRSWLGQLYVYCTALDTDSVTTIDSIATTAVDMLTGANHHQRGFLLRCFFN